MKSYIKPGIIMVSLHTEERLAGSACNGSCTSSFSEDINGNGIIDPDEVFTYLVVAS